MSDKPKITLKETWQSTLRMLKILSKADKGLLPTMLLYQALTALTPYVAIFFSARLLSELSGARDPAKLRFWVLASLISALVLAILIGLAKARDSVHQRMLWYSGERIMTDKLMGMDYSVKERQSTQDLWSQVKQNRNFGGGGIQNTVQSMNQLTQGLFSIAGGVSLSIGLFLTRVPQGPMAWLNTPACVLGLPAVMVLAVLLVTHIETRGELLFVSSLETNKFFNRAFFRYGYDITAKPFAMDVRVYNQQTFVGRLLKSIKFTGGELDRIIGCKAAPLSAAAEAAMALFTGAVYLYVCLKAWAGAFGVGEVAQYVASVTALAGGVRKVLGGIGAFQAHVVYARTEFKFLDLPNEMYQGSLTTEKRSDNQYQVEFRNVSFRYPGAKTWALRNLSMKFTVGQRLAVVGENGSGKTTFIKLLTRMYDPDEGEILLNGIDIRKYDYRQYLALFSVVFQDFRLLAYSLGRNVAASQTYDAARAEECLDRAGFGERLKELPKGLDTTLYKAIDKEGVEPSGGEAQKIALARALYKDAPFIVLDEPTAALDPLAEYEVYSRFNDIVGDRTAIYISHRLSSCRFCDVIAVFDQGQVVQTGSHEALLSDEGGQYARLWNAQAQYYTQVPGE